MFYQIFGLSPKKNQRMTQKTQTTAAIVIWLTNSKEMRAESEYLTVFFQEPGQEMENRGCKVRAKTQELLQLPMKTTCFNWYECSSWAAAGSESVSLSKRRRQLTVTESFSASSLGTSIKWNRPTELCWLHPALSQSSHAWWHTAGGLRGWAQQKSGLQDSTETWPPPRFSRFWDCHWGCHYI